MTDQTYHGSCQCHAVEFEAVLDLEKSVQCNCSRCKRLGWVATFTPRAKLRITKGEGDTTQYLFHKARIRHQFCPVCGIEPFAFLAGADGTETAVVNVNVLDGVDPRALSPKQVDGRSF